jgi:homeobox protein HoxA/B/C/D4
MSYPHVQGSMGTGYEPKFPPSETDFHHLHHHHTGYGAMNGLAANHVDYSYHNHNGYNYGNYTTPTPTTHSFYHHHPPYGSPQMHHPSAISAATQSNVVAPANAAHPSTNAPSPNTNSSYVTNVLNSSNNNNNNNGGNRSSVNVQSNTVNSTNNVPVQSVVNGLNVSENSPNVDNNIGYYNSYYATANGHHNPQDLPLHCASTEPPANTALGLQELGEFQYERKIKE